MNIDTTVDLAHSFGHAFFKEPTQIQVANYPHTQNILPSGRSVYIGIGGGSDVVQATQVATIAEKPIACIISVRANKTQSQGDKNTQIGMKRTVENHGGEVVPNVYRIRPETTGNGRFMENIPARIGAPVYLVLDLPERVVTDKNNPWNPFVVMTEPMRFIAVMDLDKHFNAITPIKNNQNTVQKYVQMKQNTRS